jgi:hypothetical protein
MDYQALKTLIQTHPQFPTVDDATLTAWVNEEAINATKATLSNEEILAVILANRAEFSALSVNNQQIVRDILYVGDSVPTAAGAPARDALVSIFGGGSATIQALGAAISFQVSRAVNAGIIEQVRQGDVEFARTV